MRPGRELARSISPFVPVGGLLTLEAARERDVPERVGGEVDRGVGEGRRRPAGAMARVCTIAGVPAVTPHGLRRTHATLAVGAGISGDAVAASLGYESFAVTAAHYAQPDAVSDAKAAKVADTRG